jgi:hypothetical protein
MRHDGTYKIMYKQKRQVFLVKACRMREPLASLALVAKSSNLKSQDEKIRNLETAHENYPNHEAAFETARAQQNTG